MIFENSQVDLQSLPRLRTVDFSPLEKEYFYVRLLSTLLFMVVLLGVFFIVLFSTGWWRFPWAWLATGVGWVILAAALVFVEHKGFNLKAYALREKDIIYRSGLIWHSITTIPFNRIQHADIKQGPLETYFNLAKLNVYTAGGQGSDLSIPGLRPDQAERLKDYILKKTTADEEE